MPRITFEEIEWLYSHKTTNDFGHRCWSMKVMKNDTDIIVSIQYGMTYLGIMKTLDEILKTD